MKVTMWAVLKAAQSVYPKAYLSAVLKELGTS
jgi:hypothetical protein